MAALVPGMMASGPRRMRGGTLVGFMVGLIVGLTIAVLVAVFVTRSAVPFVNKTGRPSDRVTEPKSAADAPDPNKPMYSKNRPAAEEPAAPPPVQQPEPTEDRASILDRLFGKGAAESAGITPPRPADAPVRPPDAVKGEPDRADPKADAKSDARATDATSYLLQAGAFRSQEDADAMKAKLALLGLEARVATAEVNGQIMYRVRVGPFAQLDDLNRARARLAENGIEASALRQR